MTWKIYLRGIWVSVPDWFYEVFLDRRWFHRLRYWRKIRNQKICSCCNHCMIVQNEDHNNIGVCANEQSDLYEEELYPDDTCRYFKRAMNCRITWCKRYFECCREHLKKPTTFNRMFVKLSHLINGGE